MSDESPSPSNDAQDRSNVSIDFSSIWDDHDYRSIQSGELIEAGIFNWKGKKNLLGFNHDDFRIEKDPSIDLRYELCWYGIHGLPKVFAEELHSSDTNRRIWAEEEIVRTIGETLHDTYGPYNKDIARIHELQRREKYDLNSESPRQQEPKKKPDSEDGTKNPKTQPQAKPIDLFNIIAVTSVDQMAEEAAYYNNPALIPSTAFVATGQSICEHYAVLGSDFCTRAGIKVYLVTGPYEAFVVGDNDKVRKYDEAGHMFVVSRATGSVIDFSADSPSIFYRRSLNPFSCDDFEKGQYIVAGNETFFSVYNSKDSVGPEEAQFIYDSYIAPHVRKFKEAFATYDVPALEKACNAFPFSAAFIIRNLNDARAHNREDIVLPLLKADALKIRDLTTEEKVQLILPVNNTLPSLEYIQAVGQQLDLKKDEIIDAARRINNSGWYEKTLDGLYDDLTPKDDSALKKIEIPHVQNCPGGAKVQEKLMAANLHQQNYPVTPANASAGFVTIPHIKTDTKSGPTIV